MPAKDSRRDISVEDPGEGAAKELIEDGEVATSDLQEERLITLIDGVRLGADIREYRVR